MTLRLIICSALFMSTAHATNGIQERWKGFSNPEIMASGFVHTLSELPLEGHVQNGTTGWSSSYWPTMDGGINVRWNTKKKDGFRYASPKLEKIKTMSLEQLSRLSPSEKYDIYSGQYDYPLKSTVAKTVKRSAPVWAGICHGWAPAAIHHNEPIPKVVTNPDGIQVPFGSADIKGLLSYFYARLYKPDDGSNQMGQRCSFGRWMGGARTCKEDLNAGAFHIVITNMLGIRNESFVADVDRYKEVWNQPAEGFKTKILDKNFPLSETAATNAIRAVKVSTQFFYVDESDNLSWEVARGTREQQIAKREYEYTLELDASGNIVGGEWQSRERPDFLWNKKKAESFEGPLSHLAELLND